LLQEIKIKLIELKGCPLGSLSRIMKLIPLALLLVHLVGWSQENEIRHFQRNCVLKILPLPNQKFVSSEFKIFIPDSLYNKASIGIKNAKLADKKTSFLFKALVENGVYKEVELIVQGQKHVNRLLNEIEKIIPNIALREIPFKDCVKYVDSDIEIRMSRVGNTTTIQFKSNCQ
jgi:hypothetical protein